MTAATAAGSAPATTAAPASATLPPEMRDVLEVWSIAKWLAGDVESAAQGLLRIVEDTLADRSYLTGENLTIADLHLSSWMDYVRMMQIDLAPFPKLSAWVTRCISRPSYKVAD